MDMRRDIMGWALGLSVVCGAALPASAAPGFATGNVNLRAGPGTSYPQVVVVPNSAPVEIFGCLQGYGWCDVGFNGIRGWVSSGYLQYAYEGRRVPFAGYAPQTGVPIVSFQFGDYWGEHYRGRPWFSDRDRWGGPPPRGPGPGYGRTGDRGPDWDRGRGPDWDRGAGRGPDRGYDRGPGDRGFGDRGPGDRGPGDRGPGDRGFGDRGPGDRGPGPGDRGPGGRGRDFGGGPDRGPDHGPGRGPGGPGPGPGGGHGGPPGPGGPGGPGPGGPGPGGPGGPRP